MTGYKKDLHHVPVLLEEVLEALRIRPGGVYLDGTLGRGGHAGEILARFEDTRVIGLDRDPSALEAAAESLESFSPRIKFFHSDYRYLADVLQEAGWGPPDGILLDLGVSSMQLDSPERGFSFASDGSLDMRMDPTGEVTAAHLVNSLDAGELARILFRYGEEKLSRQVARAIAREREAEPITTTSRLAEIVKAVPGMGRVRNIHPATRTFQALRIVVNDELGALEKVLPDGVEGLKSGGRMAIISFHSLEDRMVKRAFRQMADPCECPRELHMCVCGKVSAGRVVSRRAIKPGDTEIEDNPRSRSARLRVFEKE
jgi:16S rRNA (cytosine1402-N4)-methyltransferase